MTELVEAAAVPDLPSTNSDTGYNSLLILFFKHVDGVEYASAYFLLQHVNFIHMNLNVNLNGR